MFCVCVCLYKIVNITRENNDMQVIVDSVQCIMAKRKKYRRKIRL